MSTTTYSFQDVKAAITFPTGFSDIQMDGSGLVSVGFRFLEDNTEMSVAADGSPLITKILSKLGELDVEVQQNSVLHKQFISVFNALYNGNANVWADAVARVTTSDNLTYLANGLSFKKLPDDTRGKSAGTVVFTFSVAELSAQPTGAF